MKKIVIDARFWGPSHTGLGRYTKSLVTALESFKVPNLKFTLLVNKKPKTKFKTILIKAKPYSIREQFEVCKTLNTIKPDLVHFLHFNAPLFYKKPFIATIHDLIKHHSFGLNTTTKSIFTYPIKRLGYFTTIKHTINNSKTIIAPSNWVKKDILSHYKINPKKITTIYEAANSKHFKSSNSDFIPPNYPYLIYIGNAYPHKNLIALIKAVSQTNLKLIIVTGRDIFYNRLRNQIRKEKAQSFIKIKGFTSDQDLKVLLSNSIAFITASLLEGFGLPGLEAMVSETLVLASKRASMPEVYGKHAIYFNPNNQVDIIKKINYVSKLKPSVRNKLIKKAKQYAATYSWEKTAKQTIKIYENCLSLR
ncbi:MAG: glycosyltransferase family 1 protein, partial [Patescibacteria group bacterium]|nr:glycosyltransferase family 1 protein [Patescibacteria group bacterium]